VTVLALHIPLGMVDALSGTMNCLTQRKYNVVTLPAQMEELFTFALPPKNFSLRKPSEEESFLGLSLVCPLLR
jgi:hypothetical protein